MVTRDLTERYQGRVDLEQTEARMRFLVNRVTDWALITLDRDGYIKDWSDGAAQIKGYSDHEIIGLHFSRFYTEEDKNAGLPQRVLEIATETGHSDMEGWRVRLDGSRFWARVIVDAMRDGAGKLFGFAKCTRDLTDQKIAEANLIRAREELLHAQKNEAIGRLSAGVAHDFNNILQTIVGSIELAQADNETAPEFYEIALRSALRGSALTHQLLSYARRQVLQPRKLTLRPFFLEFRQILSRTLNPRISIKLQISGNPSVIVDRAQFETALLNLAINASDATPADGELIIDIRPMLGRQDKMITITIHDHGTGMSEETLALAVEPFFTTKGVEASGLGLSMVQGFAEQSGGGFEISSTLGSGTSAKVTLPSASRCG